MRAVRPLLESATFRVALLYMALFALSVAALLGFIHYATAGYLARQTDAAIAQETAELANRYRAGGVQALAREITNKSTANIGGRSVYLLVDEEMEPIAGNLNRWPEKVEPTTEGWLELSLTGPRGEPVPARARVFRPGGKLHLLIGRNVAEQHAFRKLIVGATGWGLLLSLVLAIVGGLLMSRTITRRLERINRTAQEVMAGDLDRRIPQSGADDEFERLTRNLNRMLDQIQYLMDSVRQVSDNIAHDLRTPLTRLRWRLEHLADVDEKERGELIEQAVADADGLLNTFQALLRIAEAEAGNRDRFSRLDVGAVVRDVGELYEPLAADSDRALEVDASEALYVQGDRDLLFQALANLVDNAVKHSPAPGTIRISAAQRGNRVEVAVADSGPGIPADQREAVLQRFVRLESCRKSPGSGLGLSLVNAVARLHSGEVELEDNEPGLRVRLCLPVG